jgi:glucose-6-phosphate dehydrogenase assembly protein OpcA
MEMMSARPGNPPAGSWRGRANSVRDIERELSRIWAAAAERPATDDAEVQQRDASRSPAEAVSASGVAKSAANDGRESPNGRRASPALPKAVEDAGQAALEQEEARVRTRTRVLTLVVVATRPETEERALDAVNALASRHPSRAIILSPGDPDGPATLDAQIFARCQVAPGTSTETCTEEILIRTGGEIVQHLTGVVAPLLIHDLPAVLWWPDDPPIGSRPFRELLDGSDRLLIDSGAFREDGAKRLVGLAAVVADGRQAVHDIGWMRLTLWRELVAGLFDHPLLMPELEHIRSVRIDLSRPGETFRITKAACFAGWLGSALGWEIGAPMARARGSDSLFGSFRHGRHQIKVEFRPVQSIGDRSMRSPGSLTRVELDLGRGRHDIRARVTRAADHLLATADWAGARVTRRAGRLEPFGEAPYIAEALDSAGPDRIFERSLAMAARLVSQ